MEPVGGYLYLATKLLERPELHGEAFNFGPPAQQNFSVQKLVEEMSLHWPNVRWETTETNEEFYESGLLKLNCDKALHLLDWKAVLKFEDTVKLTAEWYRSFYEDEKNISETTDKQINIYQKLLML